MKKQLLPLFLAVSLLLSGCSWPNGSYVSVTPHREPKQNVQATVISADDYLDLIDVLVELIASGTESAAIDVSSYPANAVKSGMAVAIRYAMENDPVGAYAVEEIHYEQGSSGGQPAVAVQILYRHNRNQIRQIYSLQKMEDAEAVVAQALANYDSGVVMLVEEYSQKDFQLFAEDYAEENPQLVMELPQVVTGTYGTGKSRVLELNFTYKNARDDLRQMQDQVKPVFDSATLYVSGDGSDYQKYSQLYAFLMERFDYTLETSITPTYSLLRHGVGDSRAFAVVYAAMCRTADLECAVVTGTKSGEPWSWNMVMDNGRYYHVDLLGSNLTGRFTEMTDAQMHGYVWDYSAYPECTDHIPVESPAADIGQTQPAEAAEESTGAE